MRCTRATSSAPSAPPSGARSRPPVTRPRVAFRDADAAIVIETLGDRAGIGIVDRALRSAYPFVRVR